MNKIVMTTIILLVMVVMAVRPVVTYAEDLSVSQQGLLKSEGIKIYPGAIYMTDDVGERGIFFWFSSREPADKISTWYTEQLPDWSVVDVNGNKLIYKGLPDLEIAQIMKLPYVYTSVKDEGTVTQASEIQVHLVGNR